MADQVIGGHREAIGRISVRRFPGSQMGPVQQHYDFARTGQADVAWFLHGATLGRFPLTDEQGVLGKKAIVDGGAEVIQLSAAEHARFRKIGAEVVEAKVKELEGKGLPGRAVYTMMRSLAEKHAKTSKSFWD